ncbi:MAG: enoyl-CoA hydratase/isomerase family protein [Pseudomonadota bacterium]
MTTEYEYIRLSHTNGIATVQLNRPDARNALNAQIMTELIDVATALHNDADLRAVILCGSDQFFSAGADLSMVQDVIDSPTDQDIMALRQMLRLGPDMCDAWAAIEVPTIAAIEGFCVGGGVTLAVSCDFRIAANNAFMKLPEVPYGMNMSWHTLPRLVALMGPSSAKEMTLFGDAIGAETLLQWGAVDRSVAPGQALSEAQKWAERIAALPPLATRMTIEAIDAVANAGHASATFADRDQFLLTLLSGGIQPK